MRNLALVVRKNPLKFLSADYADFTDYPTRLPP